MIRIHNLDALKARAREFVSTLKPGAVIGLVGPLGAGKTTLVKCCVEALGGNPAAVTSPTFVVIHHYTTPHPAIQTVLHLDGYRLKPGSHLELGLDELIQAPNTLTFVEWPDRFTNLMCSQTIVIDFSGASRSISIK